MIGRVRRVAETRDRHAQICGKTDDLRGASERCWIAAVGGREHPLNGVGREHSFRQRAAGERNLGRPRPPARDSVPYKKSSYTRPSAAMKFTCCSLL